MLVPRLAPMVICVTVRKQIVGRLARAIPIARRLIGVIQRPIPVTQAWLTEQRA